MNESNIIDFGIFEDFSITFNTSNITNIFPLNHRECIASTSKEIIRFERKIIKTRFPYTFSSCLIVPETEYIIGVTFKYGTLTVFKLSDISEPILKDYQTNHNGIFHMFYSHKSNSLITIGSGIHVFTFHYLLPDKKVSIVNPKVSFTLRSSFASNYDTTIIIPPPFDPETELIYLPTLDGICPYTLDGNQLSPYTRIPATIKTVYTFNHQSKELLTYDSTDGMSLWGPSDNLICHFSTAGSSLISMLFVDQENVICLNSFNSLFFLNIKTSRTFHCITLQQRPTRLFLLNLQNQPILFVCFANAMKAMKIVIPWRVWNINVKNPIEIQRCNKFCEAARVIVATRGSFIKFYAPKNGEKVTAATPKLAVNSTSFFYDRGLFERYTLKKEKLEFDVKIEQTLPGDKREVLFVVLENGKIIGFNTTVSPCDEVMSIKSKATFMTICRYGEKWAYAVASENSDLYILDYQNLNETHHFTVINDKLLKMFFHYESDSIIMVFKKKTVLFDLKKGQIGDTLKIDGNNSTSLFANMLKYGYESGHIAHVEISDGLLVKKDKSDMQRPHSEKVSCFSFSLNFWISLGFDGKVIFWDYSNEKICQLSFPVPLVAGVIMNGKRDVLAATESEVMLIKGSSVFGKNEVDREIAEIDNFDRINDKLSSEVMFPLPSHDNEDDVNSLLKSNDDDDDEYEYAEEEEVEIMKNLSSTFVNDSQKIEKKIIVEDNEEQKMKKLEAMQALNGVKQKPPELENLLKEEAKKVKNLLNGGEKNNNQKVKKNKKQSSISRHDEKSLANFIASSMEKEKEQNESKPKKEKSAKKRSKSNDENENENNQKNIKTNKNIKIEKINDSNNDKSNKNKNKNEDDDENLVLRMKDNKRVRRENNRKSDNDNSQSNEDEVNENDKLNLNQSEQSLSNQKNNDDDANFNEEKSDSKDSQKVKNSIKETKKSSEKVKNLKATEQSNKKLVSVGIQPDSEKQKDIKKKTENKESNQNQTKSIEKVDTKVKKDKPKETKSENENDKKNVKNSKSKNITEPKSDTKSKPSHKSKETKTKIKQPSSDSPSQAKKSPRKKPEALKSDKKSNSRSKINTKPLNSNPSEIENKPIKPPQAPLKKSDPLSGKRPRCPTPPIIRWKKPTFSKKPPKRASTPPLKNEQPIMFSIPPPNIVLDKAAVLEFYGRGKTELKPLVDLINEESERIRAYYEYYSHHVKSYGTLNRFDTNDRKSDTFGSNPKNGCRNRFFYRRFPEPGTFQTTETPPACPSFYGSLFLFNDDMTCDMKNEESNFSDTKNRKSEVTSAIENLPKFHKMQYAKPLSLIDKSRKKPSIKMPNCSSQKCQFHKLNQNVMWPDKHSKIEESDVDDEVQSARDYVEIKNDNANLTLKQSNIHHNRNLNSARNLTSSRPNWSLFYPNFESCSNFDVGYDDGFVTGDDDVRSGSCVDLLANAVMLKVPSLELPVSPGYKRTKSVRYRSPTTSRRIVNSPFYHQNVRKK